MQLYNGVFHIDDFIKSASYRLEDQPMTYESYDMQCGYQSKCCSENR